MATGRFFKQDGSFSEETVNIPDDELETPMKDTEQEQKQVGAVSLIPKMERLTDNEMKALFWLSVAYIKEQDQPRRIRQRQMIEMLLGMLTLGEWMALGPTLAVWVQTQTA